ncbi:hypothetical protein IPH25_02835 [bacterium]|nr:MAG: hypothetical protein IPG37_04975 [bacterium]QQR61402.1 MAG: hypothetical protein IPH25_02835 [bacterium]QQR63076.1 MAG: hypothetical protein IPH67_01200 [bacterium]
MWRTMKVLNKFLYFFVFVLAIFDLFSSQTPSDLSAFSANPASNLTRENARSLTQAQRPNPQRPFLQRGEARRFSQGSLKVVVDNLNVTPEKKLDASSLMSEQEKLIVPKLELPTKTQDNTSEVETEADSQITSSQEYESASDGEGESSETAQQRIDEFMANVKEVVRKTVFDLIDEIELDITKLKRDYATLKISSEAIIEKLRTERKDERKRLTSLETNFFNFKQLLNEPYKNIATYGPEVEKLNKTMLKCLDAIVTIEEQLGALADWRKDISKKILLLSEKQDLQQPGIQEEFKQENQLDNPIKFQNLQTYWHWYSMNNPFFWVCLLLLFEHYDGRVLLCAMYNQLDIQNKLQSMQSYFS